MKKSALVATQNPDHFYLDNMLQILRKGVKKGDLEIFMQVFRLAGPWSESLLLDHLGGVEYLIVESRIPHQRLVSMTQGHNLQLLISGDLDFPRADYFVFEQIGYAPLIPVQNGSRHPSTAAAEYVWNFFKSEVTGPVANSR